MTHSSETMSGSIALASGTVTRAAPIAGQVQCDDLAKLREKFLSGSEGKASSLLLRQADWNLAISLLYQVRWSRAGMSYINDGVLMATTGEGPPIAPFNAAIRLTGVTADAAIDTATSWFASRERGFSFCALGERDADLEKQCRTRGLVLCADMPVMAITRHQALRHASRGIELRIAEDPRDFEIFRRVTAQSFSTVGVPEDAVRQAFAHPASTHNSLTRLFLALVDGDAVGGLLLIFDGSVTGAYWLSVLPDFRRKGIAKRLADGLVQYAFDQGAEHVILQASPLAERIYRELGFAEVSRMRCYCRPRLRRAR